MAADRLRVSQNPSLALLGQPLDHRIRGTISRDRFSISCDQVRGEEIQFDLARDRVRVIGAASVVIRRDDGEGGGCVPGVSSGGEGGR